MKHIVLLGDSILDNKAYVGNEPDVIASLQNLLTEDKASLKAIDGSVVENVSKQLRESPSDATHLVVSIGGNNALMNSDILQMQVKSSAEVFDEFANRLNTFEFHYEKMIELLLSKNLPTAVCTIYFPNIPDEFVQKISVSALTGFNDVIIRQAAKFGIPYLDLRLICNEKDDYANEIEPSSKGGRKIAEKIVEVVNTHDFSVKRTSVYF
jgi:lysophospholipase L1-like esterase